MDAILPTKPPFQTIDSTLMNEIATRADGSPRKRSNHNFHELSEVYQRFLNVLTHGTYIQPHRHSRPPKPETFIALQGELGFLLFDEAGRVTETFRISSQGPIYGIDIQPGVWHSVISLTPICVCFEGKSGPYDPHADKEFSPAYPTEGSPDTERVLQEWELLF